MPLSPLPIDEHLAAIALCVSRHRAAVVVAPPGSGKTTRVPPTLAEAGPVMVLQPRRLAARAVARRVAEERGWSLGREVGWQVRFERRYSADTRVLVVTEGILTARLQHDPLLSGFATIVLDEFHERNVHTELGIALAKQAWLARTDLRIVVMSATLDGSGVARFLGNCPVIDVPGTLFPLDIEHAPGQSAAAAVAGLAGQTSGHILCFLPGAREIEHVRTELAAFSAAGGLDVVALHGSLEGEAQDAALRTVPHRRVVLATNIAETSLTVPGVSTVIDSGLVKVARYDVQRGVDSLRTERVSEDSAAQRAGRAARLGPGRVRRLWDSRDRLRAHIEPEMSRVDLAGPVLAVLAWGSSPWTFEWFEPPPRERVAAALQLLLRLGAIEGSPDAATVTPLGRLMQSMPLHPRLARILVEARGDRRVARACTLLSAPLPPGDGVTTSCDLLPLLDRFDRQPAHTQQVARTLQDLSDRAGTRADGSDRAEVLANGRDGGRAQANVPPSDDRGLRHALFLGYGDRLAKRRPGASDRFVLATGHGATLGRECGVRQSEYLVALDVVAAERDGAAQARIRAASRVEPEWVVPSATALEHALDPATGRVRAVRVARHGAIVLNETPMAPDPAEAARLLCDAWLARTTDDGTRQLLARAAFADTPLDLPTLAAAAAREATCIDDIDIGAQLPVEVRNALARQAPSTLTMPSGRALALQYASDGSVSVAVKLQEVFGLGDSPRLGPRRVPVTFHLLAPNGRPVQTTRDLRSFWVNTYPEVRKQLRGRYPKHPWPEDPWTATPTHRATPRR